MVQIPQRKMNSESRLVVVFFFKLKYLDINNLGRKYSSEGRRGQGRWGKRSVLSKAALRAQGR